MLRPQLFWSFRGRGLVAALLLALIGYGLALGPQALPRPAAEAATGDAALYRAIEARVAQGEGYYRAAATEQRRRGYPLRPFVTVRLPTLAWLIAGLGGPAIALRALKALGIATLFLLALRLREEGCAPAEWAGASVLLILTLVALVQPLLLWWHELWAGMLVMLALALRTPRRWRGSLVCAFLAVSVRELALPLLPAMALAAAVERRRGEALAWGLATLLALLLLAGHAAAVAAIVLPGDKVSPGWGAAGGWRFDLGIARECTLLTLLPSPLVAMLLPLSLFGWIARAGAFAGRVALFLGGMLGAFLFVGRPDNIYWGLLLTFPLTAGIVLAPAGLYRLVRTVR